MTPPRRRTTPGRLRLVALALLLSSALLACNEPDPSTSSPAATSPRLRVGTSGDYPPFSYDGAGFDVDVARAFARHLGLEIEWVSFRWPELTEDLLAGRFDVVMSGVTWRPQRAVHGTMSRAVAQGGPCLVGEPRPTRLAVNRGGILERFARQRYSSAEIVTVDDNLTLPDLLADGAVDAFLTDSFEVRHFRRAPWQAHCHPPVDRKVYWVAPGRAESGSAGPPLGGELGPLLDEWLRDNEPLLARLRAEHFGAPEPRDELDHLVDLLSRRLELMPWVAAYKREHALPIEDLERESVVLAGAAAAALRHGLAEPGVERLFALQIELAKRIQERSPAAQAELDLGREIRPLLLRLGERILAVLGSCTPLDPAQLGPERLALLTPLLERGERDDLRAALLDIRPAAAELTSDSASSSSSSPCRLAPPSP